MPAIDVAMARSLQPGTFQTLRDAVVRSVTVDLVTRDMVGDTQQKVTDVGTAFSSWDNCMAASFCKYPVIAVMAIGGLILFGILWCIIRCCCCGLSCCCSCFRCLKCCGDCCGCCDDPKEKDKKGYMDQPYAPPHQAYQPQAPMHTPFASHAPAPAPASVHHAAAAPPQYAEFDVKRKGGEDALPEMPSWEGAGSRKVEVEEESVELEPLKKSAAPPAQVNPPMAHPQHDFGPRQPSPMSRGQSSPYGPPQGQQMGAQGGYMPAPRHSPSPGPGPGPGPMNQQVHEADGYGLDQPYDMPMAAAAAIPRQGTPSRNQDPYNQYPDMHNQGYAEMPGEPINQPGLSGYAQQGPRRSPGPQNGAPMGYGMQRQGTGDSRRGPEGYGMQRQGTDDSRRAPEGYGMQRQGTGDSRRGPDGFGMQRQLTGGDRMNNASPAPYAATDPRARQSPGPGPRRTPGPPEGQYPPPNARRTPGPPENGPYGPGPGARRTPGPAEDPYNQGARQSPRPYELNARSSPGPQRQVQYGNASPQGMPARHSPAQDYPAQEVHMPMQPPSMRNNSPPSSPIVNNGGFDFTSGFSRPSAPTSPVEASYPGYKPYQPAPEPWKGV